MHDEVSCCLSAGSIIPVFQCRNGSKNAQNHRAAFLFSFFSPSVVTGTTPRCKQAHLLNLDMGDQPLEAAAGMTGPRFAAVAKLQRMLGCSVFRVMNLMRNDLSPGSARPLLESHPPRDGASTLMKSPPAASNRRASQDWTVGVFVTPEERPTVRDKVNGVVVGIPLPRRRKRRNAIGRVQDEIPCCRQVRRCDKARHDRSGGHQEFQSSHLALLQDRYLACSILHNSLTVRKCPRHRLCRVTPCRVLSRNPPPRRRLSLVGSRLNGFADAARATPRRLTHGAGFVQAFQVAISRFFPKFFSRERGMARAISTSVLGVRNWKPRAPIVPAPASTRRARSSRAHRNATPAFRA
jgi:hypothetical protein